MTPAVSDVAEALSLHMPEVLRWAGAIARQLRKFNVALSGKSSGSAETDALTLADLTVQELVVSALRDRSPLFRKCRIEAEEANGDIGLFATDAALVIALDPIDGTKQYRDRTGNGYAVMLHLRDSQTLHYSLVFVPETGANGTWVEAIGSRIVCGPDDPSRSAREVLDSMPLINSATRPKSKKIYSIGFQKQDAERATAVTNAGLHGFAPDEMPGSIYPLLATGEFGGSLIHSPNIYDFPVSLHLARILGGDAVWTDTGEPVHFRELWLDDRADMLRLPRVVACSAEQETLEILKATAQGWPPNRYND
ncbi:MAG: inositol monophosphatase [Planctomycetia bacterium]|nr:inositol monophosphatase [Planctomycetia bacterium]